MSVVDGSRKEFVSAENETIRYLAAAFAFTSQAIHLWILPDTFVVTLLPGMFFLLTGISQGLLGVSLLFGPSRWSLRLGVLLNLLLVVVWVVTRIVSLPALTGSAEPDVGLLGIVATSVEIILVVLFLKLLSARN